MVSFQLNGCGSINTPKFNIDKQKRNSNVRTYVGFFNELKEIVPHTTAVPQTVRVYLSMLDGSIRQNMNALSHELPIF